MGKKLRRSELKLRAKGHAMEHLRKPYRKEMNVRDAEHVLMALVNNVGINGVITALHNVCCHGDAHTLSKIDLTDEQLEGLLKDILALKREKV